MGKFERFSSLDPGRGYSAGPSIQEAARLDGLMGEFKIWFTSMRGFGPELERFFAKHEAEFNSENVEEHSHAYFLLYSDFVALVEKTMQNWLQAKGLHEDDFGVMLAQGQRYGDSEMDALTGVLLGLLDYPLWIEHIFALRREVLWRADWEAADPFAYELQADDQLEAERAAAQAAHATEAAQAAQPLAPLEQPYDRAAEGRGVFAPPPRVQIASSCAIAYGAADWVD